MRQAIEIAVTGAGGFIGRQAVRDLCAMGHIARPIRRSNLNAGGAPLVAALGGASAVLHLAARMHVVRDLVPDPEAEFQRVNVALTRRLVEAAAAAGVRRVVLAGSVKAMGEASEPGNPWTEERIPRPCDAYGRSKLDAEGVVLAEKPTSMEGTVLRLPLVIGPGVQGNLARLVQAIMAGMPIPVPRLPNRRSLVCVENVVAALAHVATARQSAGEVYLVAEREPLSTRELVQRIATALGCRPKTIPLPRWLLAAAGRVGDLVDRVGDSPVSSKTIRRLTGHLEVDSSKVRKTGYVPQVTLNEGIRRMAASFQAQRGIRP